LYKPFEHHHEVKPVFVLSHAFTFHFPPVNVVVPVASVTEVVKAGHVTLMLVAAPAIVNVYVTVVTLANISVGDEQQLP
jgi:hypothetical protein